MPLLAIVLIAFFFSFNSSFALENSLSEKLNAQFLKYNEARDHLILSVTKDEIVSRKKWEDLLQVSENYKFSSKELELLRNDQNQRILKSYEDSKKNSIIDLDAFRRDAETETLSQFCIDIPKGGMLHIHPSGTLNEKTVQTLLEKNNPTIYFQELLRDTNNPIYGTYLYPHEVDWLSWKLYPMAYSNLNPWDKIHFRDFFFLPKGSHPFERFDVAFYFLSYALQTWENIFQAWIDFSLRAARQNVRYVEFTTGVSSASIEQVGKLLTEVERTTGVTIRINKSFARVQSREALKERLNDLLSVTPNKWIVGIDLLANERNTPALETSQEVYGTLLKLSREGKTQLQRTMHAGELGDLRNPRDAMIMGVQRIGHGVLLNLDPVVLEYAVKVKLPLEINLTSNLKLQVVENIQDHPFLRYLRLGLPISLSTDDEGIFQTDISHECQLAVRESNITYAELKQMAWNSIETSFVDDLTKEKILNILRQDFVSFEKKWVSKLSLR